MNQEQLNQDKRIYTMTEERPAKAVVQMGVPLIAGMLLMVVSVNLLVRAIRREAEEQA